MTPRDREKFDRVLEKVLADLPATVHQILDEVPLIVEDHPSQEIMREMDVTEPDELCGLYDGVPLSEPEVAGRAAASIATSCANKSASLSCTRSVITTG